MERAKHVPGMAPGRGEAEAPPRRARRIVRTRASQHLSPHCASYELRRSLAQQLSLGLCTRPLAALAPPPAHPLALGPRLPDAIELRERDGALIHNTAGSLG